MSHLIEFSEMASLSTSQKGDNKIRAVRFGSCKKSINNIKHWTKLFSFLLVNCLLLNHSPTISEMRSGSSIHQALQNTNHHPGFQDPYEKAAILNVCKNAFK